MKYYKTVHPAHFIDLAISTSTNSNIKNEQVTFTLKNLMNTGGAVRGGKRGLEPPYK